MCHRCMLPQIPQSTTRMAQRPFLIVTLPGQLSLLLQRGTPKMTGERVPSVWLSAILEWFRWLYRGCWTHARQKPELWFEAMK